VWGKQHVAAALAALCPGSATAPSATAPPQWRAADDFLVLCHATDLPPRRSPPVRLLVLGHPRANAGAKDSEWVRQRQDLERQKPADVEEIILCERGNEAEGEFRLLEGSQTNFYVVAPLSAAASIVGGAGSEGQSSDSASPDGGDGAASQLAVYTAGDGVLAGTVRRLVLEVCAAAGVPVVLRAPSLRSVPRWTGCLVSSTSRLLLPADEIIFRDPAGADESAAEVFDAASFTRCAFAYGPGSAGELLTRLAARVEGEVDAASQPL
jgi:hypothetical protein